MTPRLIERHQDYVLGPNQDSRLASVAAGAVIKEIELRLDPDAPFLLRSRAVRVSYSSTLTQDYLQGLATRWTGPIRDYRQQDYVRESLQMAFYGQGGNAKPLHPGVLYPANGILVIDITNFGTNALKNLTFFWRGVKLFPPNACQWYTYPQDFQNGKNKAKIAGEWFNYQVAVSNLGQNEIRQTQIFTVRPDADFVLRGGQATAPFLTSPGAFAEVGIKLLDADRKPYSNDYIPLDIMFGSEGFAGINSIPLGSTHIPMLSGPWSPGLFYPEIYVPKNQQLLYNLQRTDGAVNGATAAQSFTINLIGQKVFRQEGRA